MGKELAVDDSITGQVVPSLDSLAEAWMASERAERSSRWRKGDIALLVETSYGGQKLQQFAAQVGVGYAGILTYRAVARAFPEDVRLESFSFDVAQVLQAQPDRVALMASGVKLAEARELVRSRKALPGPKAGLPKPKKDAFLTAVAQIYYGAEYLAEKTAGQPAGISPEEWAESLKQLKAARTMLSRHIMREDKS